MRIPRFVSSVLTTALVSGALIAHSGCEQEGDDDSSVDAASHGDAGHVEDEEIVPCTPEYPDLTVGHTASVGDLKIKVVAADLIPARQLVNNDWELQISDPNGPVADANIIEPYTWMGVHRHKGVPDPKVVPGTSPGNIKLDNVRFRMRGPWDVIFLVTRGGQQTMGSIKVCVR